MDLQPLATPEVVSRPTLALVGRLRRAGRLHEAVDAATVLLAAHEGRPRRADHVAEARARYERGRLLQLLAQEQASDDDLAMASSIARSLGWNGLAGRATAGRAAIARAAGRHDDARALASEAMTLTAGARDSVDHIDRSEALLEFGLLLLEQDAASAAAPLDEAVELATHARPGRERDCALALAFDGRAELARVTGDFAAARADLRRALALARRGFGSISIEVAQIHNDLGVVAKFSGAFDEADRAYRAALAILRTTVGDDHPEVATVLHNVAGLAHARGRFADAVEPAQRSVDIRERALGTHHPAVALDRAGLAAILDRLGRSAEAEAILREVLPVLEATLGPRHREVAVTLNNLAAIAAARGDLAEAERLYQDALAIKLEAIGDSSPSVGITLNNLGTVLRRQGQLDAAESAYLDAIRVLAGAVKPDHPALTTARSNLSAVRAGRRAAGVSDAGRPADPPGSMSAR